MSDAVAGSSEHNDLRNEGSSVTAVLDQDILANLRGLPGDGDDDLLAELIDLFLRDTPPRLLQLGRALLDGDAKAASHIAHSLKGSSANLGARGMAQLCNEIELQGRAGELHDTTELHTALEREFARVFRALELERRTAVRAA